ncbi:hypothetical protein C2845_PM17G10120 [Panicum miliaceum]|uniref:Uncharacterized protein n=1 Tax=Panicum miliaceum TaxID=4540 RepID=A0A3L6Q1S8_PANMI|nr:hypothetical protein C2845_PM17G10120 [Panicum miliaceum]
MKKKGEEEEEQKDEDPLHFLAGCANDMACAGPMGTCSLKYNFENCQNRDDSSLRYCGGTHPTDVWVLALWAPHVSERSPCRGTSSQNRPVNADQRASTESKPQEQRRNNPARDVSIAAPPSATSRSVPLSLFSPLPPDATCSHRSPSNSNPNGRIPPGVLYISVPSPPSPVSLPRSLFSPKSRVLPPTSSASPRARAPDPAESAGAAVDWHRCCGAGALGAGVGCGSSPGSADSGAADET